MKTQWPLKRLDEVCEINPKLNPTEVSSPDLAVSFVPMAAIDERRGEIATQATRPFRQVAKGYTSFRNMDVLFARITPCLQNGKAAIARKLSNGIGFGSTEFHILRAGREVLPEWIFAFVRQSSFKVAAEGNFTGTVGQQRLPADFVKRSLIPIPPIQEQQRVVRFLQSAENLSRLRDQADRRTSEMIPAIFHEMFGDPITNSKKLPVVSLDKIASVERGKFTPRPRNDPCYYDGEYPFIQTGDIAESGGVLTCWRQTLNEKGIAVSRQFTPGTVLIAIVGATIGETAILGISVYCTDSVVGIQPKPSLATPEYIWSVLRHWRPIFLAQAPDTARANINLAILKPLKVPLPTIELQRTFAARVAEVRALEAQQAASRRRLDDLFQSLLHRAFRGEL